ncbi:hypothetical protein L2E82_40033 [Cichorium intybus]|uniref:Uncharacterized protein n=1 Tax=Cichorium intybus TaxID=13427 RepID=A0ACB9AJW8_CICIN|nr:hypothetical protein L2E82_40033 [Cichorium intybus]
MHSHSHTPCKQAYIGNQIDIDTERVDGEIGDPIQEHQLVKDNEVYTSGRQVDKHSKLDDHMKSHVAGIENTNRNNQEGVEEQQEESTKGSNSAQETDQGVNSGPSHHQVERGDDLRSKSGHAHDHIQSVDCNNSLDGPNLDPMGLPIFNHVDLHNSTCGLGSFNDQRDSVELRREDGTDNEVNSCQAGENDVSESHSNLNRSIDLNMDPSENQNETNEVVNSENTTGKAHTLKIKEKKNKKHKKNEGSTEVKQVQISRRTQLLRNYRRPKTLGNS